MNALLVNALKNAFHMKKEDAEGLAKTVENIFKGRKEIEDMSIDKYQRALLYELQKENLLKLRREELKEQGKKLRKYYWSFNHDQIQQEAHKTYCEYPVASQARYNQPSLYPAQQDLVFLFQSSLKVYIRCLQLLFHNLLQPVLLNKENGYVLHHQLLISLPSIPP